MEGRKRGLRGHEQPGHNERRSGGQGKRRALRASVQVKVFSVQKIGFSNGSPVPAAMAVASSGLAVRGLLRK